MGKIVDRGARVEGKAVEGQGGAQVELEPLAGRLGGAAGPARRGLAVEGIARRAAALRAAGIRVADSPADLGSTVVKAMGR